MGPTENFWRGFDKSASDNPIEDWLDQAKEQSKKKKEYGIFKQIKIDPRELSEDHGPDATHRYWP